MKVLPLQSTVCHTVYFCLLATFANMFQSLHIPQQDDNDD